jgi:hypothetical protein
MAAVAILGASLTIQRAIDFADLAHHQRHLALECGCVRDDAGRLPWHGCCIARFHSGLTALYGGCADLMDQPSEGCGAPILDPIPGDPKP